ncbi:hypothetical protein PIB30_068718 [Stylosanthes scabra]|uniref:Putative plant transposon protein domain-containing protein n=1 Tax=Stylosanthes scabra TaxID=79078 RepID=A0ABU6WMV9_9FABA|nr:hypothetical protein [Stylosanthes scabra]
MAAVNRNEQRRTLGDYTIPMDFFAAKIRKVLKIRFLTPGVETDFKTRQMEDQRLDEVIRDICMPGARWKISTSQPDQPIQLKRQDLTPLARGWAEFIIHSIIPIIKGHDVRVEELIAYNIAIIAEAAQGRSKLSFPSTIFTLCKEVMQKIFPRFSTIRQVYRIK